MRIRITDGLRDSRLFEPFTHRGVLWGGRGLSGVAGLAAPLFKYTQLVQHKFYDCLLRINEEKLISNRSDDVISDGEVDGEGSLWFGVMLKGCYLL